MKPRWTYKHKAELISKLKAGELNRSEAMREYEISSEELASWERLYLQFGELGLRATKVQAYRRMNQRRSS